jgi:ribosomal protein L12E/L44/L45/RPP1/RPP2
VDQGAAFYDKVIKQLLLEVLKSTIDSLMENFYKEPQVKQAAPAEKDKAAAAETAAKQPPQQQQGRQF